MNLEVESIILPLRLYAKHNDIQKQWLRVTVLANASGSATNRYDFDRNKLVNVTEVLISRANPSGFTPLRLIGSP